MVTVVDANRFNEDVVSEDDLLTRKLAVDETDTRTIVDLLIDQIEFADVLVLNKTDLVDDEDVSQLEATLRHLNPQATLLKSSRGNVPLSEIVGTNKYDAVASASRAGWMQELMGNHTPETEEYGIKSFVYRNVLPFHPQRLWHTLNAGWDEVVRSKGFFWLASRPDIMAVWSQAGTSATVEPQGYWYASMTDGIRPTVEHGIDEDQVAWLNDNWDPLFGDRRQELVFIGIDMDEAKITEDLTNCLLSAEELVEGVEAWCKYNDPWPSWVPSDSAD
jgi:G3E family GTPase